jgi:uncharacterized protein YPO0396
MPHREPDLHLLARPGFRLRRLEMLNWGTFHEKVAVLAPECGWTLVVGENGSGKSTAVDALRTLLVPPRLLAYNDASGDQRRRDRSRKSYVRGAWATSSQEDTAAARVEYLRQPGEQSILLAVFGNELTGADVTLAQVLWEASDSVHEIYAIAREAKSIRDDLSNLGKIHELKKSLRARGFEPFDRFPAYEETLRSRLGIPSKGALEVFNQAIGVKEIADVNSFIRRHMLEPSEAFEFIDSHLKPHYKELDACFQAIQKASAQIAKLEPICDCHRRIEEAQGRKTELETLQQVAPLFYSERHLSLRMEHAQSLEREIETLEAQEKTLDEAQSADAEQRVALEVDLAGDQVGLRIKVIELEQAQSLARKRAKDTAYQSVRSALGLLGKPLPFNTTEAFAAMRAQVDGSGGLIEGNRNSARQKQLEAEIEQREENKKRGNLLSELDTLRKHQVLIPREFVAIRQVISSATGIGSEELPFAGELMEVKTHYREWTGAIERLLHSFGVSLLVPERHYLAVTRFINRHHLGLRFQYHRVPAQAGVPRPGVLGDEEKVPTRLNFKDHALSNWVTTEVCRRFSHVCCRDEEQLRGVDYGLTREGLIRNGPTQHIKDDRRAVNDITSYVLGWSIESKIKALEKAVVTAERNVREAGERAATAARQVQELERKLGAIETVLTVKSFAEVDFEAEQAALERLEKELQELEASSDRRKTLKRQLGALIERMKDRALEIRAFQNRTGEIKQKCAVNAQSIERLKALLAPHAGRDLGVYGQALYDLQEEKDLRLDTVEDIAATVGRKIQGRLNQQTAAITRASDEMLPRMADFLRDYPEETAEKKAEVVYGPEFAALRERLQKDELPKHEQEFERFLSLNLIGDMAMFSTKLDEHRKEIEERIAEVNRALRQIPFSESTHVQIVIRNKSSTDESAAFRAELRACLSGGLNPSTEDRLRIFTHIRELIGKFERDVAWTQRVTDARNWLEFGMKEYADGDGREVNYYAASSGKSGGQKTKLAFTILASAITAQYGLIDAESAPGTFRFVVIDEAFARTDESNSERALKLFQSLGLQLLVVSPFDAKSRIVEDYVDTFHLTLNPEGNSSHVHLASRLEYDAAYQDRPARVSHAESG